MAAIINGIKNIFTTQPTSHFQSQLYKSSILNSSSDMVQLEDIVNMLQGNRFYML